MALHIRNLYGAGALHVLAMAACFSLVGYTVLVLGPAQLWNTEVWWQSIVVWFIGAAIAHDLVMFPLYALADRAYISLVTLLRRPRAAEHRAAGHSALSPLNYIRIPSLASALTFIVFFPGIIRQGAATYVAATGQTQDPFLQRWLLLTGAFFAVSAVCYAIRLRLRDH